jgi:hypothetical protein
MCNWGEDGTWNWATEIANSWRMSGDIKDVSGVISLLGSNSTSNWYIRPLRDTMIAALALLCWIANYPATVSSNFPVDA